MFLSVTKDPNSPVYKGKLTNLLQLPLLHMTRTSHSLLIITLITLPTTLGTLLLTPLLKLKLIFIPDTQFHLTRRILAVCRIQLTLLHCHHELIQGMSHIPHDFETLTMNLGHPRLGGPLALHLRMATGGTRVSSQFQTTGSIYQNFSKTGSNRKGILTF